MLEGLGKNQKKNKKAHFKSFLKRAHNKKLEEKQDRREGETCIGGKNMLGEITYLFFPHLSKRAPILRLFLFKEKAHFKRTYFWGPPGSCFFSTHEPLLYETFLVKGAKKHVVLMSFLCDSNSINNNT
jgi:hypothetical protein